MRNPFARRKGELRHFIVFAAGRIYMIPSDRIRPSTLELVYANHRGILEIHGARGYSLEIMSKNPGDFLREYRSTVIDLQRGLESTRRECADGYPDRFARYAAALMGASILGEYIERDGIDRFKA